MDMPHVHPVSWILKVYWRFLFSQLSDEKVIQTVRIIWMLVVFKWRDPFPNICIYQLLNTLGVLPPLSLMMSLPSASDKLRLFLFLLHNGKVTLWNVREGGEKLWFVQIGEISPKFVTLQIFDHSQTGATSKLLIGVVWIAITDVMTIQNNGDGEHSLIRSLTHSLTTLGSLCFPLLQFCS